MYSRGFVYRGTKLENDAEYYIQAIISTTYEDLTAEVPANDYTFKGILNSTKDVNGLIRYRYDILVNHLKTAYGIDLQATGYCCKLITNHAKDKNSYIVYFGNLRKGNGSKRFFSFQGNTVIGPFRVRVDL